MRYTVLVASALSMAFAAPIVPPTATTQIVVVHRFTSTVCAGLCVDETIRVSSDGRVTWLYRAPHQQYFHWSQVKPARFLVPRRAAAAFGQHMTAIEPPRDQSDAHGCYAPQHVREWDWDIRWTTHHQTRRLLSCDANRQIQATWAGAIRALGMPGGLTGPFDPAVQRLSSGLR